MSGRAGRRRACVWGGSVDHVDLRPVTWRSGEPPVAGHDRRLERFGKGYVHGVVRRDVLPQLPRSRQQIDVGMTVKIEVGKQQEFEDGRGVDDDHAESRSSRMTTAAGVFNLTGVRRWIRVLDM